MDHPAFHRGDLRRILQWDTSLGLDFWEAELRCCELPLPLVAAMAGQGKIAGPIASSPGSGNNMLHFQGERFRATVRAFSLPLFQDILTQEVPLPLTLLVFQVSNVGVLHALGVKTAHLDGDSTNWQKRGHEAHSLDGCLGFGGQRRRQPPIGSASIVISCFTIACLASPTVAP